MLTVGTGLLLSGCNGGPPFVTDRDAVLRISVGKAGVYRLSPENIKVRAGRIRVIFDNRGRLTHNLAIREIDTEIGEEPVQYLRTETAQPGERVTANTALGPGRYRILCTIGNHDDLGEYGELQVTKEPRD